MALPKANVVLGNGNLGRTPASEDGTCGLVVTGIAVGGKFALGDVMEFKSLAEAEAKGIDEAYDTTNSTLAWHHIRDFYEEAPEGTSLFILVAAKANTIDALCLKTNTYAKKLLSEAAGKIKVVGISWNPDGTYVPTYADQIDTKVVTAVTNLQALLEEEFELFRPARGIIECRDWQGTVSTTLDLRNVATSPNKNKVSLFIGQNSDTAALGVYAAKSASIGYLLGRIAAIPVQRNVGRVKDGPVEGLANAGFSNNGAYSTLTDVQLDSLNDKGYIFFRKHTGISGFYLNDDHTACPLTDDYAYLSLGRTIDKGARITRRVYLDEVLNEVATDPNTGKLPGTTCKHYQGLIEKAINEEMVSKGECAKVTAFVDPNQNVVSTSKVESKINILPQGTARTIEATLAYESAA